MVGHSTIRGQNLDLMGQWPKLGQPKIRSLELLKYDIEENREFGVRSIVRGLGLPSNFTYMITGLNIGPIWVREEDWVKDIQWACGSGVELFVTLPQMDCSRKHVIIDDTGNCFSTKIAWKTTKRL